MCKTIIIAEAGVNHNGSLENAKELVRVAKKSGADIVKFQTINVNALVSKHAKMAEYQKRNSGFDKTQKDMLRELALRKEDFCSLADYCKEIGIQFLSTPFDIGSIQILTPLQELWKIPSGEITDYPYLVEIAKTGKKILLSTGMSTLEEVHKAVNVLKNYGSGDITLMHCTTEYPAAVEDVNLRAMLTMQNEFQCRIGYSDHTAGMEMAIAAVAMGASVIEKHFTLDRNMIGPDHKASLEPDELERMIKAVRQVEIALGSGIKIPSEREKKNLDIARKSIVAYCDIKKGEKFSENNITTKRPGNGISPMQWNKIIGTCAIRDFEEDELIEV